MAKTAKVEENKTEKKEVKVAPKAAPSRRTPNQGKPNFFVRTYNGLRKWFQETIGELRKVHWPTREEALFLTRIVIVVIVVMKSHTWRPGLYFFARNRVADPIIKLD